MDKIEIRKQAIVMYLANQKPSDICQQLNRSRTWFYKWMSRNENDPQGIESLFKIKIQRMAAQ